MKTILWSDRSSMCKPRFPEANAAFTLVELLAVMAVVAILFALQIPALARMTRQTKVAHCSENLRQLTQATHMFAHENNDRLPNNEMAGFWLWDTPPSVTSALERYGAHWKVFYCPGTAPRFSDQLNFQLWNYSPGYRVVGYVSTFPGTSTLMATNVNSTLTPPLVSSGPISYRELASERVLQADATVSSYGQNDESQRDTYNYTTIIGGFPTPQGSSHVNGRMPLGGNVSMLDGHVEWRNFFSMHPRTSGGSPVFWW